MKKYIAFLSAALVLVLLLCPAAFADDAETETGTEPASAEEQAQPPAEEETPRQPPTVRDQSGDQSLNQGDSCTLWVDVDNSGGYELQYVWHRDGDIFASGAPTCEVDTSEAGTYSYSCEIVYYVNNEKQSSWSNPVRVTVDGVRQALRIELFSLPSKLKYKLGEELNTYGLGVTVFYDNGSTERTWVGFTCSPTVFENGGEQTVTVSYGGKTATFTVNVSDTRTTDGIEIAHLPNKLRYKLGDTLNTAGLSIAVYKDDGGFDVLSSGFTCNPTALEKSGVQTVTVEYMGRLTSFDVTVGETLPLQGISVASLPTKCEYTVGEMLDVSGMTLALESESGTETVNALNNGSVKVEPMKLKNVGEQTILVTYTDESGSYSCQFLVSVKEKPAPEIEGTQEESGVSTTVIVLAVIAALALIAFAACLFILLKRNRNKAAEEKDTTGD